MGLMFMLMVIDSSRLYLEQRRLQESADLYAQIYDEDYELQAMTACTSLDWPA